MTYPTADTVFVWSLDWEKGSCSNLI